MSLLPHENIHFVHRSLVSLSNHRVRVGGSVPLRLLRRALYRSFRLVMERVVLSACRGSLLYPYRTIARRPTRGSTRREAEYRARRPSRLDSAKTHGVTPLASRTSNAGQRRAALPHARDYLSRVNL